MIGYGNHASPPFPTFADFFAEAAVDFAYFDSITSDVSMGMPVIPRLGVNAFEDPRAFVVPPGTPPPTLPLRRKKWWVGATGSDEVLFWPYLVNGGAVMICAAGDGNGVPWFVDNAPVIDDVRVVSMLVYNYYFHFNSWGSNKNRSMSTRRRTTATGRSSRTSSAAAGRSAKRGSPGRQRAHGSGRKSRRSTRATSSSSSARTTG